MVLKIAVGLLHKEGAVSSVGVDKKNQGGGQSPPAHKQTLHSSRQVKRKIPLQKSVVNHPTGFTAFKTSQCIRFSLCVSFPEARCQVSCSLSLSPCSAEFQCSTSEQLKTCNEVNTSMLTGECAPSGGHRSKPTKVLFSVTRCGF